MPPATGPPAGWYRDPRQPGLMRWWDGWNWSPATRPEARPQQGPGGRGALAGTQPGAQGQPADPGPGYRGPAGSRAGHRQPGGRHGSPVPAGGGMSGRRKALFAGAGGALIAAVVLVAALLHGTGHTTPMAGRATAATHGPGTGTTAPAPVPRLTLAQARTAYVRITRPFNTAVAAVNRDVHNAAPWSQFRADTLAVARADRTWARRVGALRWPARIQRYMTAMRRTDVPSEIRCDQAMAAAGNMQAATTAFSTNPDCKDRTANENHIRSILGLHPVH